MPYKFRKVFTCGERAMSLLETSPEKIFTVPEITERPPKQEMEGGEFEMLGYHFPRRVHGPLTGLRAHPRSPRH